MRRWFRTAPLVCLVALVAAGCGSSGDSGSKSSNDNQVELARIEQAIAGRSIFHGQNGEKPVVTDGLEFSQADLKRLRDGDYTAAMVWHDIDASVVANEKGIRDELRRLGISVVARTDAAFDAGQQKDDYETVIAKHPDAIITLPIDTGVAARALRPAVERGISLAFEEIIPDGFVAGRDYVGTAATDYTAGAIAAAHIIGDALGGRGKLAFLYFDADFFITNQWDAAFKRTIEADYPRIDIVAEQGFADTDPAKVADVAGPVIAKNPDIDAIYATYQDPLSGVLSALRQAGRTDVKLVDLGFDEPTALEIAKCNGMIPGVGAQGSYVEGKLLADLAAYGVLGKRAPPLVISRAFPILRQNLAEGWKSAYGVDAPASVLRELQKDC